MTRRVVVVDDEADIRELADLLAGGSRQVDDLAAALDQLWVANRTKMMARGEAVLAALQDAAAGRPIDRPAAAREAHALAGALGAYGRPGSALFAEVERILDGVDGPWPDADEPEADLASCAERVRQALAALD